MNTQDYEALRQSLKQADPLPKQEVEEKVNELAEGGKDILNIVSGGVATDTIKDLITSQLEKGKKVTTEALSNGLKNIQKKGVRGALEDAKSGANAKINELKGQAQDAMNNLKKGVVDTADKKLGNLLQNTKDASQTFRDKVNTSGIDAMRDSAESFSKGQYGRIDPFKLDHDTYNSMRNKIDLDADPFSTPRTIRQGASQNESQLSSKLRDTLQLEDKKFSDVPADLEKGFSKATKAITDIEEGEKASAPELDTDPIGMGIEAVIGVGTAIASAFIHTSKQKLAPMPQIANYSTAVGA